MASHVREPAVAGRFYPAEPGILRAEVRSHLAGNSLAEDLKRKALGCIAPHAGYMYSGAVAGAVYAHLDVPQRCVVLCPNHTGLGHPLAIMSEGSWNTPLGAVSIDSGLAVEIKTSFPDLSEDAESQRQEHGIEVQLPFLKIQQPSLSFVPITLGTGRLEVLEGLGRTLAGVIKKHQERILVIASSDMNHYENDSITRVKDHKAIEKILELDARGLFDVIKNEKISMCGFGPAIVMLTAAKFLGARRAELVRYATSGDVSGDLEIVVGYAGVAVW
ncbi:MAG: hypothetical protein QOD84_3013 [Acidobacteriaceae bacterium]